MEVAADNNGLLTRGREQTGRKARVWKLENQAEGEKARKGNA